MLNLMPSVLGVSEGKDFDRIVRRKEAFTRDRTQLAQRELNMRTVLTAIVVVVAVSPIALAEITLRVSDTIVSDQDPTGSFEVYLDTSLNETPTISGYQTQLILTPGLSGISIGAIGAVEDTVTRTPLVSGSTIGYETFTVGVGDDSHIVVDVDAFLDTTPTLFDEAGLFKVEFDINMGAPPYATFDVAVNTDNTVITDGAYQPLAHATDNGVIEVVQSGPHELRVTLHEKGGGGDGNWEVEGRTTTTLLLTYGKTGATLGRTDSGDDGDVAAGWGNDKFAATSEGDYGVYTRGAPFGSGDDMLVQDARPLNDTSSNVLIETYTNKVFDEPSGWVNGVTWNEGGTLEFTVLSDDKTYFDDFQIVQKEPGRFLAHDGVNERLGDHLIDGVGTLDFDRVGCDWIGDTEVDWWIGPFAGFDLIPPGGTALSDIDGPLSVEKGTFAIGHPHTPEPSSLMLLALAGFGACAGRRKSRRGQG
ncbi:MAG: PEP-CTERM sorting domain-containing protein [Phycisphaerae bacterium]|nr:PEP-CTERM sorting domain-containing protein [Phycisphaerae bacterium]